MRPKCSYYLQIQEKKGDYTDVRKQIISRLNNPPSTFFYLADNTSFRASSFYPPYLNHWNSLNHGLVEVAIARRLKQSIDVTVSLTCHNIPHRTSHGVLLSSSQYGRCSNNPCLPQPVLQTILTFTAVNTQCRRHQE